MLNTATTVPLRRPATSPTSAPGTVPRNADPPANTHIATMTRPTELLYPSSTSPAAETAVPTSSIGRRPTVSVQRPTGSISAVSTTADTRYATAAHQAGSPRPCTISSGTTVLRMPKTDSPSARLVVSAAWYSRVRSTLAKVGSAVGSARCCWVSPAGGSSYDAAGCPS